MGKVSISEPVKGEALTVTKLNSTIASWTTEASNINAENVHDQSLDHYNFADNSVREINENPTQMAKVFASEGNSINLHFHKWIHTNSSLDFTNDDHIFRVSFLINVRPDYHVGLVTESTYYRIKTELLYEYSGGSPATIPGSERELRYEHTQVSRSFLEETIGYSVHLNNIAALTGTVSNLSLFLKVKFQTNDQGSFNRYGDYRAGIYQLFAEVETIKR